MEEKKGFFDTLFDLFTDALDSFLCLVLKGLASVIESIPVPQSLVNPGQYQPLIDPEIRFFLEMFLVPEMVVACTGAYVLRFFIRRIPLVG